MRRIGVTLKAVFICLIVISALLNNGFAAPPDAGKQSFDFTSSLLVSVGYGAALCLLFYHRKRE